MSVCSIFFSVTHVVQLVRSSDEYVVGPGFDSGPTVFYLFFIFLHN